MLDLKESISRIQHSQLGHTNSHIIFRAMTCSEFFQCLDFFYFRSIRQIMFDSSYFAGDKLVRLRIMNEEIQTSILFANLNVC